jgi:hypothetical protein
VDLDDYNTPHELVERYYEKLAHAILWGDSEKFTQTIINIEQNLISDSGEVTQPCKFQKA